MKRKLRFGIAAIMDGQAELVAGAFSADAERSRVSGQDLMLDPARVYGSFEKMAESESAKPDAERLDFIAIVTPNHLHFPPTKLFLEAGFNVVCDKPVTFDVKEARALKQIVEKTGKVFALTHNYTGNVMVKQAREMVKKGKLGSIRKVIVEYPQGWLASAIEASGQKQADWRTDPKRSGAAGCMGDLGSHAENLAAYITGLKIKELCADLTSFVPGRTLDDDGSVLLRFHGGAKGILHASQISAGDENNLNIRVYGSKASLEWHQEHPNELILKFPDQPRQIWRRGNGYVTVPDHFTRVPFGHPEGYLEAFGNIYQEVFRAVRAERAGRKIPQTADFPKIDDGLEGMLFIDAVVQSSRRGARWVKVKTS